MPRLRRVSPRYFISSPQRRPLSRSLSSSPPSSLLAEYATLEKCKAEAPGQKQQPAKGKKQPPAPCGVQNKEMQACFYKFLENRFGI